MLYQYNTPTIPKFQQNGIVGVLSFQSYLANDADSDEQQRQKEKEVVVGEVGEIKDHHQQHA